MEIKENLKGTEYSMSFANGVSNYISLISQLSNEEKRDTLFNSIGIEDDNIYYQVESFKSLYKRCERARNFEFMNNYLYFYRVIKGWNIATCVRAMNVFVKYDTLIDFSNITLRDVFNLFNRVKSATISESSKRIDWRKLKQMIRFAGFPYDLSEFRFPETSNKIEFDDLLTSNEFTLICEELKRTKIRGFEYGVFFTILADTGCRTSEVLSITKKSVFIRNDSLCEVIVRGKTGERSVVLYHSSDMFKELLHSGWNQWSFDYFSFYRQLKRVCKRLGIRKRVYNHLLRHCFGSYIAQDSSVSVELKNKYCGWSAQSRMLETTYAHFNQRKVIEKMKPVLEKNPLFH